ncbi:cytochrome P450 [Novosphingobium bradum]|uniref:Cytochrome P450 n=1 Tax=Novosphingobium bradum TaxID=1737444 RepID=A0ABV7IV58_9SPHN
MNDTAGQAAPEGNRTGPALGEPGWVFNPYGWDFARDPYPIYTWLRDNAPVYYHPQMNFYLLSRYDDVWRAHRDAKLYSSKAGPQIERRDGDNKILLSMDAPEHGWAKAMMTKVFSRERMAALDGFIRRKAGELLEAAYARHGPDGEWDLVNEFSVELPLSVISELLGIPEELRGQVHHLANRMLSRDEADGPNASMEAHGGLFMIFFNLTQQRRAEPKDDPVSMLIALEIADENGAMHRLDDSQIASRFMEMALAGHETVAKAIPNGLIGMELFPSEKARLRADLSLAAKAVQETLRFDPPSQLQGRVNTQEITLHGVTIPADSRVMLATGAATRDPRAFPNPDVFDIERDMDSRTIAFGYGVHKCLGIHLAQQEILIAFEELFTRFPNWKVFPERAKRIIVSNVRGVAGLPVVLGPHA